jgi:acyl carrier protein
VSSTKIELAASVRATKNQDRTTENRSEQARNILEETRQTYPELDVVDAFVLPTWFYHQGSWITDTLNSDNALYNYSIALKIAGPLDQEILKRSLSDVQRQHEVLRSVFRTVNGRDVQIVLPPSLIELQLIDLQRLGASEQKEKLPELMREMAHRPFNLSNERLLRVSLYCLSDCEHVLQLDTHHIVCDDWSTGILIRDLFNAYDSLASGKEIGHQEPAFRYVDFIRWREQRAQPDERRQSSWKAKLGNAPSFLHLQPDFPRPHKRTRTGATLEYAFPVKLTQAVGALCQDQKVTVFMVVFAAFQSLLHAYSGAKDVGVGTCAANRPLAKVENVVGRFANDILVRTDYSGDPSFREIIARTRDSALDAYNYQDLPFGSILESLFRDQEQCSTPLFQTTFIFQNAPKPKPRVANLDVERIFLDTETAKYDLAVWVKSNETINVSFEYDRDLFRRETIMRMAKDYARVLEMMTADPEQRISQLALSSQNAPGTLQTDDLMATTAGNSTFVASADLESALLEIWREVLGIQSLGTSDDFFEIGGDSLRAAQLIARIQQRLGKQLSLPLLFSVRTIKAQAEALRREQLQQRSNQTCGDATQTIHDESAISTPSVKSAKPKSLLKRAFQRLLHTLCRVAPGATTVRPFLHRMRGVQIGKAAWIGDDVYLENEYPECIEIRDGAILSIRTVLIAHTRGMGKIVVGKNAFIGAGSIIVTSGNRPLVIGEGAVIMASSLVNGSVAPYTLYGSDHSRPLARLTRAFTADTSYEELISTLRPL